MESHHVGGESQGAGLVSPGEAKAAERSQSRGDRARLLLDVHRKSTRDNSHKLQKEILQLERKSLKRMAEH